MTTLRLAATALCLAAALLASGCSSKSSDSSSGAVGMNPTSGSTGGGYGPGGNQTGGGSAGSGMNATTPYTCTAAPGGVVGAGGPNGATVSGCALGTSPGGVYAKEDIDAGCSVSYDTNGDGVSDGTPKVGDKVAAGTTFSLGCGATNPTGKGTIYILE